MSDDQPWWLGRGAEPVGPYAETQILAWIADGTVGSDQLAWREGMPEWRPVRELFPGAAWPPAPLPANEELPPPTGPHWLWLIPIALVTLGIAVWIWAFVQASWVRRIDPRSRASTYLLAAVCCIGVQYLLGFVLLASPGTRAAMGNFPLRVVVQLAELVLFMASMFSMSESMRRVLPRHGLGPKISGVMLLFFNVVYMQAQMNWVARALRGGNKQGDVSALAVVAACIPFLVVFYLIIEAIVHVSGVHMQ